MIGRNVPLKRKLIEQSSLLNLLMPHHDSVPSRRLNQRISPSATADFFNKIGHFQTSADATAMSAFLPLATELRTLPEGRFEPRACVKFSKLCGFRTVPCAMRFR